MGRKPNAVPSYLKHRTGQAFVKVQGKNHYLGLYGSPESRVAYTKFLAQLGQSTTPPPTKEIRSEGITITEALIAYWRWTEDRFKKHRGDARAANDIKMALRLLRQKYGDKPLAKFAPSWLITLREDMAKQDLARVTINRRVTMLKTFARWTVSRELAPSAMLVAIQALEGMRYGEGGRETARSRDPVPVEVVEATLPYLPPLVAALVMFIRLTGCRVGEARKLTTGMIDQSGPIWRATLVEHKTARYGRPRIIFISQECQAVLKPWLRPDNPDAVIFDPKLVDERSNIPGRKLAPGEKYNRTSLAQCLRRACARAFPHPEVELIRSLEPTKYVDRKIGEWKRKHRDELDKWNKAHCWSLAQLRHTRATEIREQHGVDVCAVLLGHSKVDMSLHYSAQATKHAISALEQESKPAQARNSDQAA